MPGEQARPRSLLAYGPAAVVDALPAGAEPMLAAVDAAGRSLADTPAGSAPRPIRPTTGELRAKVLQARAR
jgi:hypothetical protein